MIYDRDAAFQHRMINLFWEHFTNTSLTQLGLAHAWTHTRAGVRTAQQTHTGVNTRTLCMLNKLDINAGPECMQLCLYAIHVQLPYLPLPRPSPPSIQTDVFTQNHTPIYTHILFFFVSACLVHSVFSPSILTGLSGAMSHIHPSPLLPCPFITNSHRCSHSHREKESQKREGEKECELLCIRPFGSTNSEHKAIGLVLLGANSFNVLISTEKGRIWPSLCDTVVSMYISVHIQVLCTGTNTFWQSWASTLRG